MPINRKINDENKQKLKLRDEGTDEEFEKYISTVSTVNKQKKVIPPCTPQNIVLRDRLLAQLPTTNYYVRCEQDGSNSDELINDPGDDDFVIGVNDKGSYKLIDINLLAYQVIACCNNTCLNKPCLIRQYLICTRIYKSSLNVNIKKCINQFKMDVADCNYAARIYKVYGNGICGH